MDTAREQTLSLISDLYKDCYGFRPMLSLYANWTQEQLDAEVETLGQNVADQLAAEEAETVAILGELDEIRHYENTHGPGTWAADHEDW